MSNGARIPKAPLTGVRGRLVKLAARRKLGRVPENLELMWHHPTVLMDLSKAGARAEKWDRVEPTLSAYAVMATAAQIGCGFCLDLHYFAAHTKGLDTAKAREVPRWREASVFTPLERRVMEYAEAMTATPPAVSDELAAQLLADLGADGLIELSAQSGLHEPGRTVERRARDPVGTLRRQLRTRAAGPASGGHRGPMTDDPYVVHRRLLFTVAYEMLGSAADAEDVLQESWVKWSRVDQSQVRDPRAYLVRIVTRAALDRLRVLTHRREDYVGPWLPEPLRTAPDVAEDAELADSLSTAMLLVLETLSPTERAVFLLREVFDLGYGELAQAVGKNQAAVRQIASRARAHVAARRPRGVASQADCRRALEAFLTALDTGDLQPLVDVLAPDVVALGDGGGIKRALPRPVSGIGKVGPLMRVGVRAMRDLGITGEMAHVNGWPALVLRLDGAIEAVLSVRVDHGLVSGIYTVRNPEKLTRMLQTADVAR